jgi:hypothetical protein
MQDRVDKTINAMAINQSIINLNQYSISKKGKKGILCTNSISLLGTVDSRTRRALTQEK